MADATSSHGVRLVIDVHPEVKETQFLLCTSRQAKLCVNLQEKLSQAKEDELQASLADTAKQLEEARAAAQEQARRLADEERQLARLRHEADMKVACVCLRPDSCC